MLDAGKRAEMDQSSEAMAELLPLMIKSIYEGFKKEFPESRAWELTRIVCFAMAGGKGVSR